jgi:hypothetical protein
MSSPSRWRPALLAATLGLAGTLARVDAATSPTAPLAPAAPVNSRLDAPLFYQVLIGEMELRAGQPQRGGQERGAPA